MDKKKLDNFQEAMKPMITQTLQGLLYDLDLLPEQLNTARDGKRYSAIVNLKDDVDKLKAENKQLEFDTGIGNSGTYTLGRLVEIDNLKKELKKFYDNKDDRGALMIYAGRLKKIIK